MLYEAIIINWDMPIQYLPNAGYDLELCTHDADFCPYGEFCECYIDPDFKSFDDGTPDSLKNYSDDDLPF